MEEKSSASLEIKRRNRTAIYHALRKNRDLSRQDIVQMLRLSLPTVSQNLEELTAEGLIVESGSVGNTGGRRAKTFAAVADARLAIGLDITRHHITAVAVDLTGTVIHSARTRCEFALSPPYYKKIGRVVAKLVADAALDEGRLLGVGIGVPGLVTEDYQTVFWGGPLNFTGATCADFSGHIPYPATLHNDANAAGFAEIWEHRDMQNAFYLMLSNFIGGSVLLGAQIYPGENIRGGEIGHLTIYPEGRPCYCGQKGHVDPYVAATVLSDHTDGNLAEFFKRLRAEDAAIGEAFGEYLYHLAITVNNLRMLFDCPIILGGYVGAYMDDYLGALGELVRARNPFEQDTGFIKACRYKNESIAAGSALYYIDQFLGSI